MEATVFGLLFGFLLGFLLGFGLLEPLEEGRGGLADLARSRDVIDIPLAGLAAPLLDNLLRSEIVVVVQLEDLDDLVEGLGLLLDTIGNVAFSTTKEGLLVTLRFANHLKQCVLVRWVRQKKESAIIYAYLLQHASTLGDLGNDLVVEEGEDEHQNSAVLALDTQLLGLDVDINILDVVNAALLGGLLLDPVTQLVVDSVATAFAVLVLIVPVEGELLLELAGEVLLTGPDGLLAHVNSPVVVLDLDRLILEDLSLSLDLTGESVIIASDVAVGISVVLAVLLFGRVVGVVVGSATAAVSVGLAVLPGLAGSLSLSLVLLALLGGSLQDETAQLVAQVDGGALTTGLAVEDDMAIVDVDDSLGILALVAENKLLDEDIKKVLELARLMSTVDDPAIILGVNVGLSTKFETEELDQVGARTSEGLGDAGQVDNDGLDTVALAFDLGLETLHLVAIEDIANIATNVEKGSHCYGFCLKTGLYRAVAFLYGREVWWDREDLRVI
ncbi:hypothetical protein VP1G_10837 [Cytospora mali]|uniref:Uncharacterized protein n=1 Tax=Cytospora mali TaxID=578113 RepID=A0A194UXG2_CYTMA|nr:hypothetical protein VP1G_10837 [Valsa mali var. pyri (nom. inval.)]